MSDLAERMARFTPAQRSLLLTRLRSAREQAVDLATEAELDPSIIPPTASTAFSGDPEKIFLTGATGFLGTYLLHELLLQTRAEVYCLVRASSEMDATSKLHRGLSRFALENPAQSSRIIPVLGDLSQPKFGLDDRRFRELGQIMDWVVHNGAWVNFVYPYARLKPANVLGTEQALRLACLGQTKPFHFVSSLSVFGDEEPSGPEGFTESDYVGADAALNDGYAQSKWVAEQLVKSAAARSLPVSIYRPATVIGDSRTGAWNTEDLFSRLVKGCILLRAVPDLGTVFNLVPVDFAARAIVRLVKQVSPVGRAFHLDSGYPVTSHTLADWITEFGYPLERLSFGTWKKRLHIAIAADADHPLFPILPIFDEVDTEARQGSVADKSHYNCSNTLALLQGLDIAYPTIDKVLMHRYLHSFVHHGFLPKPETA